MGQKLGVIWVHQESSCTYKPGEMSKIFAIHADKSAAGKKDLFSEFLPKGFIASRHFAFAPSCNSCNSCVPLRIRTSDYEFSRNDKAVLRHNNQMRFNYRRLGAPVTLSGEHYDLFRDYATMRHPGTGMEKWNNAVIQEYMEGHSGLLDIRSPDGTLAACVVFNYLDKGLAPYSIFYDPAKSTGRTSLGTLCILKMIEHAKATNPGPVYLGHWVDGSQKLDYKKNFRNLEALTHNGWQDFDPTTHLTGPDYQKAIPSGANHLHFKNP